MKESNVGYLHYFLNHLKGESESFLTAGTQNFMLFSNFIGIKPNQSLYWSNL